MKTTEATLEQTTLSWFEALGYKIEYVPDIAFDGVKPERERVSKHLKNIFESGELVVDSWQAQARE